MNWISLKERLPNEGERVVVWTEDGWECAEYSYLRKVWVSCEFKIIEGVIHWAYIEEPTND